MSLPFLPSRPESHLEAAGRRSLGCVDHFARSPREQAHARRPNVPGADPPRPGLRTRTRRQQVRCRLAPDQRQRLELRNQGHDWAAMAAQVGGVAESLPEKLARGIDRVVAELGQDHEP